MTPLLRPLPRLSSIAIILAVLLVVAVPRLLVIGGLPTTDEGVSAYFAQLLYASIAAGRGLPDSGMFMLYPLLTSWVFALDLNPLITLRLIDIAVAVVASYALYKVLEAESSSRFGAALIAIPFLFTMNQPTFVQFGFKNSMYIAYLPMFTALWLGLTARADAPARRWVAIGGLLSIAVLFRETFVLFAVVGAVSILIQRGFRCFFQLMAGATVTGLAIFGGIAAARGGVISLINSYRGSAKIYAAAADQRLELFLNATAQFLHESQLVLAIAAVGLSLVLVQIVRKSSGSIGLPRVGFWLTVALVPLIEPAAKIGFAYHFAVCLPGLAGLTALGWRAIQTPRLRLICGTVGIASLLTFIPTISVLWGNWPQSKMMLANIHMVRWPQALIDKSNYLFAADIISQVAPPGGTVAVSGYMLTLYPLTGLLPPTPELANLTNTIIEFDLSAPRLAEALLRCPPDVVMSTSRTDWPGAAEILAAVRETGIYEQVAEIPTNTTRVYSNFGGLVFRATRPLPCQK